MTIKEIAQRAEVSVGTVSRVLNRHQGVNAELQKRVLQAARELGYRPPEPGRSSESGLKEIGYLLIEEPTRFTIGLDSFWPQILHGVQQEATRNDIRVVYMEMHQQQSPEDLLEQLQASQLQALLVVGLATREQIAKLYEAGYLVVLIDTFAPAIPIDAILSNGHAGAYEAVAYLIQEGHRDIAFIGGPQINGQRGSNTIYSIAQRASGFRSAHIDAGLPVQEILQETCNLTPDGGYAACQRLLETGAPFSAILCANDKTALGAMNALRDAGKRIPEQCSVIGFDDIELAAHLHPALTTLHVPRSEMGHLALQTLLKRVAYPEHPSVASLMQVDLIKRQSVSPPE